MQFENISAAKDYVLDLKPNCFYKSAYWKLLKFNGKYSKPIIENNIELNSDGLLSVVKDHVFFKIEDRKAAFENVIEESQMFLKGIGYLKMSESKLIEFLSKRIIEKTKLDNRWKLFNNHFTH